MIQAHVEATASPVSQVQADDMARAFEALSSARCAFRCALGIRGALYGLTVVDLLLVRLADYDDPSRLDRLAGR
jgi:hypothetical protein